MRRFWIEIRKGDGDDVYIKVGKGAEAAAFMRRAFHSTRYRDKSWPPTHVAFAAWNNKIEYEFCLKKTGKIFFKFIIICFFWGVYFYGLY